jgi:hypothetical protein
MDWVTGVRFPAWKMFSSVLKNIQIVSEVQEGPCSIDTGVLPQVLRRQEPEFGH